MDYQLSTPKEIAGILAERNKNLRLSKKWKRTTLSERSGVSVASLIRFEQTAQISLNNFLKLLSALGRLDEALKLLMPPKVRSIEELEDQNIKTHRRGLI